MPDIGGGKPSIAQLLQDYGGIPTPLVSDNLDRYPGAVGLKPLHGAKPLIGPAYTVRTRSGDNLAVHKALENVTAGDVLVIDGGGDESRALVGEIMMEIAITKSVAGFVIDGAIRDVAAFAAAGFPCFARSVIHRGPYKFGPGEEQVLVSVGGMPVSPGDLIIGDEDGILAVPPSVAQQVLSNVQAQVRREAEIIASIRNGTYAGAYGAQKTA
jgi:regulator of RNase E activity RraA